MHVELSCAAGRRSRMHSFCLLKSLPELLSSMLDPACCFTDVGDQPCICDVGECTYPPAPGIASKAQHQLCRTGAATPVGQKQRDSAGIWRSGPSSRKRNRDSEASCLAAKRTCLDFGQAAAPEAPVQQPAQAPCEWPPVLPCTSICCSLCSAVQPLTCSDLRPWRYQPGVCIPPY